MSNMLEEMREIAKHKINDCKQCEHSAAFASAGPNDWAVTCENDDCHMSELGEGFHTAKLAANYWNRK